MNIYDQLAVVSSMLKSLESQTENELSRGEKIFVTQCRAKMPLLKREYNPDGAEEFAAKLGDFQQFITRNADRINNQDLKDTLALIQQMQPVDIAKFLDEQLQDAASSRFLRQFKDAVVKALNLSGNESTAVRIDGMIAEMERRITEGSNVVLRQKAIQVLQDLRQYCVKTENLKADDEANFQFTAFALSRDNKFKVDSTQSPQEKVYAAAMVERIMTPGPDYYERVIAKLRIAVENFIASQNKFSIDYNNASGILVNLKGLQNDMTLTPVSFYNSLLVIQTQAEMLGLREIAAEISKGMASPAMKQIVGVEESDVVATRQRSGASINLRPVKSESAPAPVTRERSVKLPPAPESAITAKKSESAPATVTRERRGAGYHPEVFKPAGAAEPVNNVNPAEQQQKGSKRKPK